MRHDAPEKHVDLRQNIGVGSLFVCHGIIIINQRREIAQYHRAMTVGVYLVELRHRFGERHEIVYRREQKSQAALGVAV